MAKQPNRNPNGKHKLEISNRVMGAILSLSELTGLEVDEVLERAVGTYKIIKIRERQGYQPAVVKDKKATFITGA